MKTAFNPKKNLSAGLSDGCPANKADPQSVEIEQLKTLISMIDRNSQLSIENLLIYALKEDLLDLDDLKQLWKIMRQDTPIFNTVSQGLSETPNNALKVSFLEYIISRLLELPISELKALDCEFFCEIYMTCERSDQLMDRYLNFCWKVLLNESSSCSFSGAFKRSIEYLMTGERLTEENRMKLLFKWIEDLGTKSLTLDCLYIIQRLLESCQNESEMTRSQCVYLLCEHHGLLNKVVTDLKLSAESYKQNVQNDPDIKWGFSRLREMTGRIQFIDFLTKCVGDRGRIITHEVVKGLWEIAVTCGDAEDLENQIFIFLKGTVEPKNGLEHEIVRRMLREMINSDDLLQVRKEGFKFFRSVFVIANESLQNLSDIIQLTTDKDDVSSRFERFKIQIQHIKEEDGDFAFEVQRTPNKLEGQDLLWKLAFLAKDKTVAEKARSLLVYLYTNLSPGLCPQIKEIREELLDRSFNFISRETSTLKIMGCLELLHAIIDEIDQDNPQRHKLHCELGTGELIELTFNDKRNLWAYKRHEIKVSTNTLACELFSKSMHVFTHLPNIDKGDIYLGSASKITTRKNTRTIRSLGIKNYDWLSVFYYSSPEIYFINHDGTLNRRLLKIFTKWFEHYSDNGKMSPQQCASFIYSCTKDNCNPDDSRVLDTFIKYDDDRDGYLALDNFLTLYTNACRIRPEVVSKNLDAHGEAYNLKNLKKYPKQKEIAASLHIVSLITSNNDYFQRIVSFLDLEDQIAAKALDLLERLPTNPEIFTDVVMLKGLEDVFHPENRDWSSVLDLKNKYKLSYCLSIVEYLMANKALDNNEAEDIKSLWSQNSQLREHKKSWINDFLYYGGREHLDRILDSLASLESDPVANSCTKRVTQLLEAISWRDALKEMTTLVD